MSSHDYDPDNVRRVKSNGYYAIYMPNHPNAFGRGFVYEHRLAELTGLSYATIVSYFNGKKLKSSTINKIKKYI